VWSYTSTPPLRLHSVVPSLKNTRITLPLPLPLPCLLIESGQYDHYSNNIPSFQVEYPIELRKIQVRYWKVTFFVSNALFL